MVQVQTGHPAPISGIYRGNHCNRPERTMVKGHTLPPCPGCRASIVWTLIRVTDTNPGR